MNRGPIVTFVLLAAVALAYYRAVTTNAFAWDDGYMVLNNPTIRDLANWPAMFLSPWATGVAYELGQAQNRPYYRPIAELTMALDYAISGPDPSTFHATNILVHLLAALCLFLWLRRLLPAGPWAGLAAIIFAIHPVHTEAVNVVSYRTTTLAGAFTFGTLLALTHPTTQVRILTGVFGFALALLSKETAVVLPALLLLQDLRLGAFTRRRMLMVYLPLLVLAGAYLLLRASITTAPYYSYFEGLSPWQTVMMVPRVFFLYVRLALLPWPLCPFYDWSILRAPTSPLEPDILAGAVLLLAVVAGALLAKDRLVSLGLGFFLVALLPVSHVVPFFDAAGERFVYVPLAGLLLAGAAEASSLRPALGRLALSVAILVVVAFGALTMVRTAEWQDSETILRATTRDFPTSVSAHLGLARLLLDASRPEEAVPELVEVTRLAPRLSVGYGLLVVARARSKDQRGAIETLRMAPLPKRGLPSAAQIARNEFLKAGEGRLAAELGL